MMFFFKNLLTVFTCLLFVLPGVTAHADLFDDEEAVTQEIGQAEVNWSDLSIRASGNGTPDDELQNRTVRQLRAERAAKLDAMRNLMEAIKNLRIDTDSTIEEYIGSSEYVRSRVDAAVRNARVVDKKYHGNGSVSIVVETPITGILAEAVIPQGMSVSIPSKGTEVYTGLIVDARGLGVKPSIAPRILDTEMREIYGPSVTDRESLTKHGVAVYFNDVDNASKNSRVADYPLVVRAVRASGAGNCDILIPKSSAAILKDPSKNLGFLRRARVIIVID